MPRNDNVTAKIPGMALFWFIGCVAVDAFLYSLSANMVMDGVIIIFDLIFFFVCLWLYHAL
jgi:hypothetical protein